MRSKERFVESEDELVHEEATRPLSAKSARSGRSVRSGRSTRSSRSRKSKYSHYSLDELSQQSQEDEKSVDASRASRGTRNSRYSHRTAKSKKSSGSRISRKSQYSHRGRREEKEESVHDSHSDQDEGDHRDDISDLKHSESESSNGNSDDEEHVTSKESPEVKGDDELDGTLKVGEIIGSLETVLGSVKNLVSLDVIREMQRWKKRAQAAEQKNWELSKEIEKLEQDVSMWQGRLRRVELRCERLKKGKKEGNKRERWSRAPFVFSYDEDSDDNRGDEDNSSVIHHEPSPQLQSFLKSYFLLRRSRIHR